MASTVKKRLNEMEYPRDLATAEIIVREFKAGRKLSAEDFSFLKAIEKKIGKRDGISGHEFDLLKNAREILKSLRAE